MMLSKTLNFGTVSLTFFFTSMLMADATKPNDLVQFLIGKWDNVSFEIADGKPIKRESYPETMVMKDADTVTITAHGFRDGKDLTKDMQLILRGNEVTMSQGGVSTKGVREGNVYSFKGIIEGKEFRFRIYAMGDKFVFHREAWADGKIQQIDMSYLVRKH